MAESASFSPCGAKLTYAPPSADALYVETSSKTGENVEQVRGMPAR